MNIEQFELILCDMYTMDAWSPPLLWKWKKEFKEASTKQWAIRELENYIRKRLHHRSDGIGRRIYQIHKRVRHEDGSLFKSLRREPRDARDLSNCQFGRC